VLEGHKQEEADRVNKEFSRIKASPEYTDKKETRKRHSTQSNKKIVLSNSMYCVVKEKRLKNKHGTTESWE
jgi:hypothetical protein